MILWLLIIAVVTVACLYIVERWLAFTWKRWVQAAIILVGVVMLLVTAGIIPALW